MVWKKIKPLVEVTTDKILRYLKEKQLQVGDKRRE